MYKHEFETKVKGIPCIIGVKVYIKHERWRASILDCPSDLDYFGHTEIEFDVLDARRRLAGWLERKIDDDERELLLEKIVKVMESSP